MAMVSCGSSRTWTPGLGSRGGDEDGSSGCALTLYIPWLRCSSKALQPFLGIVFGWVVGAKSWQLRSCKVSSLQLCPGKVSSLQLCLNKTGSLQLCLGKGSLGLFICTAGSLELL